MEAIAGANRRLRDELAHCYNHLRVVFEMTEHIAGLDDPDAIETALFRHLGDALHASEILVFEGARWRCIYGRDADNRADLLNATDAFNPLLERARRAPHSFAVDPFDAAMTELGHRHALLGTLRKLDDRRSVVLTLRSVEEGGFDRGDQLAAETVLVYGGHILRNALMMRCQQSATLETVCALANAVETRDPYTHGHSERVAWLARVTGEALDLPDHELRMLEWAGLLHDVGKIGVPESILNKDGPLSAEEFDRVKQHPRLGYEVLQPVSSLASLLDGVLYHHENYDGSGYPEGISGTKIPLSARILRVVDTFDAITSSRAYRAGMSFEHAINEIQRGSGTMTDPAVTAAFLGVIRTSRRYRKPDYMKRFGHIPSEPVGENSIH